jgi:ABC-2 type transport system permease protein
MAFLGLAYLFYFIAMVAVSLAVSARVRSSRFALIILLGFWIVSCLIAPRAAADLAKQVYPTPSSFDFERRMESALRNGIDGQHPADQRTEELKQELFRQYSVTKVEDLPVSFRGLSLQASEDHGNAVFDHFFGELWHAFAKQEQVHTAGSVLAPFLAIRSVSMGFSGTDFAQHAHFARAAEDYRRTIQTILNRDITYNMVDLKPGETYERGTDLWSTVPSFQYEAPSTFWVLERQWPGFAVLLTWILVASAMVWRTAIRMSVD